MSPLGLNESRKACMDKVTSEIRMRFYFRL